MPAKVQPLQLSIATIEWIAIVDAIGQRYEWSLVYYSPKKGVAVVEKKWRFRIRVSYDTSGVQADRHDGFRVTITRRRAFFTRIYRTYGPAVGISTGKNAFCSLLLPLHTYVTTGEVQTVFNLIILVERFENLDSVFDSIVLIGSFTMMRIIFCL